MLAEHPLELSSLPMTEQAKSFVEAGRSRFETVDCFEFVPSDYELVWQALAAIPPCRFCEWGSGFGIVTGMAEMLGHDACGIEFDAALADASRILLRDFKLKAPIITGDYLTAEHQADIYFVYCWPSRIMATESRFETLAPPGAKLFICFGQSQILCKMRIRRYDNEIHN